MESTTIIICTEKGVLENMSKILITSIRKFGGVFSNCPIYSFQPRKAQKVSQQTKRFFEDNQVEFIDLELNKKYAYYPLANKPMVCAWAEENLNTEILVFLDSDVVIFNEPKEFLHIAQNEIRVRPVDLIGAGSNGDCDENALYWHSIYRTLGVTSQNYVNTTVDQKKIFAYWNTGHIVSNKTTEVFSNWKVNFEKVISRNLAPKNGRFFIEQSTFAATVSAMSVSVKNFAPNYNYPVHLHEENKSKSRINDFTSLVSWHYHDLFESTQIPNNIKIFLNSNEKGIWLSSMLDEHNLKLPSNKKKINEFAYKIKNSLTF